MMWYGAEAPSHPCHVERSEIVCIPLTVQLFDIDLSHFRQVYMGQTAKLLYMQISDIAVLPDK